MIREKVLIIEKKCYVIFQMIEGCVPFSTKPETEVPKAYVANERPPFRAPPKHYAHGLKE